MSFRNVKINVIKIIVRNYCLTKLKRPFSNANDILPVLKNFRIIPDLLYKAPEEIIFIKYSKECEVKLGSCLGCEQTKDAPICAKWGYDKKTFYTLYLGDLDCPSPRERVRGREWLHWLVTNIPCNDISSGAHLAPYIGPWPMENTGMHRYVFLLFKQRKMSDFAEERNVRTSDSLKGRSNFSISEFRIKYCLGEPIAVNFFGAVFDGYAKMIIEQYKKMEK